MQELLRRLLCADGNVLLLVEARVKAALATVRVISLLPLILCLALFCGGKGALLEATWDVRLLDG